MAAYGERPQRGDEPIVGAAAVPNLLADRRALLQPDAAVVAVGSR